MNNGTGSLYLPEELINLEVGAKGNLSDNVTFTLAGFYGEYDNIQVFINPPENPGSSDIVNAAAAVISGIDFEVDWRVADRFSLDAVATRLTEAEYASQLGSYCSGSDLPMSRSVAAISLVAFSGSRA